MRYIIALLFSALLVSCSHKANEQMSRFHEDGRIKPSVAVASMLDTTNFDLSWSLSDEMTQGIMDRITTSQKIYVHSQQESPFTQNPFGSDLSWMKREFLEEEFVVFSELVEHEFAPVLTKGVREQECPNNLNMAVRIRVVDLRGAEPKIVLQEMIRDSYFIPKSIAVCDYTRDVWGTPSFRKTPMGVAHAQLIERISERISDYVLLAKSR